MTVVVDSSAAVKWYVPEDDAESAVKLRDWAVAGGHRLEAPEYFLVEIAAVLWKKTVIMRQLKVEDCAAILGEIGGSGVATVPDRILLEDALDIAIETGVTVYDSLYLALAQKTGSCFVTADTGLQRKLAVRFRVAGLHNWEKVLSKAAKGG